MKTTVIFILLCVVHNYAVADDVLWKSGMNLHIKLADQRKYSDGRIIPNQHPVSLSPKQIKNALSNINVWNKSFFTGALKDGDELESIFSREQARLLGSYISAGLQRARPDQDIVFVLVRRKKKFLFMKDTVYTGGRAFYVDGKLNIIIGDYDKLGDKFKERAYQSSGISEIKYYVAPGKRAKRSGFKKGIILTDGITTRKDKGKTRKDWFVIDVALASATFLAEQSGNQSETNIVDNERYQQESARSAQERREMRLEMARLRKEMKQQAQGETGNHNVEQRLEQLQGLKEKNLISEEEYEAKRKEILGDI